MNTDVLFTYSETMFTRAARAYTLIEVIVVLGITTVILLLISMALDLHVRQMSINRTEIEEAQLARTLLNKLAQEIRSAIVPIREENLEVDTTALAAIMGLAGVSLSSTDSTEGTSAESDTEIPIPTEEPNETANSAESSDTGETDTTEEYEEDQAIYGTIPGIYGNLDWIQIDTVQLPRGEFYGSRQIRRGTSDAADRLSASKTILYYLGEDTGQLSYEDPQYQPEKLIGAIGRSLDTNAPQYGLFRRQLDRQAMRYAIQEGIETEYEQYDEPIAPEVEWIEFYYFDPTLGDQGTVGDWVTEWDMDDRQMLPLAVQIVIAIRRPPVKNGLFSMRSQEPAEPVIYSMTVPISVTVDIPETEETTEEAETDM